MAEIAYLALLLALGFVYVLNAHLDGTLTRIVDVVLAIVMLALLVLAFFLFHWLFGIVGIVLTLAFTKLIVPVASRCASRILGYRTGLRVEDHAAFNRWMSGKTSIWDYFQEAEKQHEQLRSKLARLAVRSDIASVLDENRLSVDDYTKLYEYLGLCGLSDLAWEIVRDPHELDLLIEMKRDGKSLREIFSAFRRFA